MINRCSAPVIYNSINIILCCRKKAINISWRYHYLLLSLIFSEKRCSAPTIFITTKHKMINRCSAPVIYKSINIILCCQKKAINISRRCRYLLYLIFSKKRCSAPKIFITINHRMINRCSAPVIYKSINIILCCRKKTINISRRCRY